MLTGLLFIATAAAQTAPNVTLVNPDNDTVVNISTSTTVSLQVFYDDPDGDNGSVYFYDYANLLLCTEANVPAGTTSSCDVVMAYSTELKWYVNISDGLNYTQGGTWNFTTTPKPTVSVTDTAHLEFLAVILIPILFGFLIMIGAATLGQDHEVLRIFLFIFSSTTGIISLWLAHIIINQLTSNFTELLDAIGTTTYIFGALYTVIIFYFLLYTLYKITKKAAKQKEERLRY